MGGRQCGRPHTHDRPAGFTSATTARSVTFDLALGGLAVDAGEERFVIEQAEACAAPERQPQKPRKR